jgi:antitoxin HigA-1
MPKTTAPVSPGEMLEEEFLKPLALTKYHLAKSIGVPAQRIGEIVAGRRAITADTDLRLCKFFGLSEGWWLRLQASGPDAAEDWKGIGENCAVERSGLNEEFSNEEGRKALSSESRFESRVMYGKVAPARPI